MRLCAIPPLTLKLYVFFDHTYFHIFGLQNIVSSVTFNTLFETEGWSSASDDTIILFNWR